MADELRRWKKKLQIRIRRANTVVRCFYHSNQFECIDYVWCCWREASNLWQSLFFSLHCLKQKQSAMDAFGLVNECQSIKLRQKCECASPRWKDTTKTAETGTENAHRSQIIHTECCRWIINDVMMTLMKYFYCFMCACDVQKWQCHFKCVCFECWCCCCYRWCLGFFMVIFI